MGKQFDCLVVGAGPAGSSAARRLALCGRTVLVVERSLLPRPKCCAGGLTPKVPPLLDFELESVVEQEVNRGCFTYRRSRPHFPCTPPLGLKMVSRDRFDHLLVNQAQVAGAEVWEGTTLLGLEFHEKGIEAQTSRGTIRASIVVGADGAFSQVARLCGLWQERKTAIALVREIRFPSDGPDPCSSYALFDFGEVSSGYRWSFPKGDRLSVGLFTAGERGKNLRSLLDGFLPTDSHMNTRHISPVRGHPLPCFGVYEPLHSERVLLCGDAAGLVDPLTGEGIYQAIESGFIAAEIIHDFLAGKGSLSHYTQAIQETFAQELFYAGRLARLFFDHSYLCCRLVGARDEAASLLVQVIRGELSYQNLYLRLKRHPLGRIYSLVKTAKTKVFGSPGHLNPLE